MRYAELEKLASNREKLIQAIKNAIPASEVKDDLGLIAAQREELQTVIENTDEEPALLHPHMAAYYRQQVTSLTEALNHDDNRAEAADIIRSLVDRIELTPNEEGRLDIDLFGDLAGILRVAATTDKPLDASGDLVQQVKLVAGRGFGLLTFRLLA